VCSDYAYGTDMANEEYKMREPLRLVIEDELRSEAESELMERFRKVKDRVTKGSDLSRDVYDSGAANPRHFVEKPAVGHFKDVVDDDGSAMPIVSDSQEGDEGKPGLWSWLGPWLTELAENGEDVKSAANKKPGVSFPPECKEPDNPVKMVDIKKEVISGDGIRSEVVSKEPVLDVKLFDPTRAPELIGTMRFKEIGMFLFAFRKKLCRDTGADDVLFRKIGALFMRDKECLLPGGLEDAGILALLTLLTSSMTYDEVLALLSDFVASAYLGLLPDPSIVENTGGVEETKDDDSDGFGSLSIFGGSAGADY
jgi:hypothetical protein